MERIFFLRDFPLKNKRVLARVDYNVPLEGKKVQDNTRIKASLATIKYLLKKDCKIILATHLGRPEGKVVRGLKVDLLAKELKRLLPKEKITKLDDCIGRKVRERIKEGKRKEIFLLENLRFYKEEEENDSAFGRALAELGDFYVNEAFSVSHRKNASVEAVTRYLPGAAGFLMGREIQQLSKVRKPKRPLVWILGGIKEDKLTVLDYLIKKADYVLIGSGLYPFLKNKKYGNKKIILPLDLNQTYDIGPKTIELYKNYLRKAKTIIWNGPLGWFEKEEFGKGSREIARFIAGLKAIKIIGGGETSEMIKKFGLEKKMTYVSMGGGASLEFLTGKKLPGILALERNYKRFKKLQTKLILSPSLTLP